MKYMKHIVTTFILSGCMLAACSEEVVLPGADESQYETRNELLGYLTDGQGKHQFTNIDFRSSGEVAFRLNTTQATTSDCAVSIAYDATALEEYNARNNSSYELFPENLVAFPEETNIRLEAGKKQSEALQLTLTSNGQLTPNTPYVIPLRIKVTSGHMTLAQGEDTHLIFVNDQTGIPDADKGNGFKVFSCMEVNDTNPLNNLSFTLKSNGKLLTDVLILFSANIRYDREKQRVYIKNNNNIQALLDNHDKYLKPLKDRGMKIILGLLPDHDGSGLCNLGTETCKAFAQEVKAMCDAYDLDGIFLDEEYADYDNYYLYLNTPGFVQPSAAACSRLVYEVKKAQPDRWNIVYAYSTIYSLPSIVEDGVVISSGNFVDYGLHDYGQAADLSYSFPGMPKSNMGMYSSEFANSRYFASENNLTWMVENGYKSHMIFAMDPNRGNFDYQQLPAMQRIAKVFYNDELVFDGKKYPKDWE